MTLKEIEELERKYEKAIAIIDYTRGWDKATTDIVEAIPALLSMARATLEIEKALGKAQAKRSAREIW